MGSIGLFWSCALALTFVRWIEYVEGANHANPQPLPHSTFMDPHSKFHISWGYDSKTITFELQVETLGYIGLGFSPNGGMAGSDIVVGWVNDVTGRAQLEDRFATGNTEPVVGESQDYELLHGSQNSTHTTLRFRRALELCSENDYRTMAGTVRVIWSLGGEDPSPDNKIAYHGTRRGTKSIIFINQPKGSPPTMSNVVTKEFFMDRVAVRQEDTYYHCRSFEVPKFDRKHHLIHAESIIRATYESAVHHMVLYGCFHPITNSSSANVTMECRHPDMPLDWRGCTAIIFAWAVGGGSVDFPEHAGYPFGDGDDPTMFLLDVHYDNPSLMAGITDSSGFRFYFTPDLREHDAGLVELGFSVSPFQVVPPQLDFFQTVGHCVPECLSQAMQNHASRILVFAVLLHGHLAARAVRVRHFRNGIELKPIIVDNSYDFNLQDMRFLEEEVVILPGDYITTECDYNTKDRNSVVHGGLSTRDEMCLSFLWHYPKLPISRCMSMPRPEHLLAFSSLTMADNQTIVSPPEHASKHWRTAFDTSADWSNQTIINNLQYWINEPEGDNNIIRCKQGQNTFDVDGEAISLPKVIRTFQQDDPCDSPSGSGLTQTISGSTLFLIILAATCI